MYKFFALLLLAKWAACIVDEVEHNGNPMPVHWYTVNLDDEPRMRWKDIAKNYDGSEISAWLKESISLLLPQPEAIEPLLDYLVSDLEYYFTHEQAEEMRGLSDALKADLSDVVLINIIYDFAAFNTSVFEFCTSIIAQGADGHIYHGRNLDYYGPSMLRKLTVNVDFQRDGKTLYKATTFVGYIGIVTGVRPNAYSLSGNQRDSNFVRRGVFDALLTGRLDFLHMRTIMETVESYDEAVANLNTTNLVSPAYFIIGGNQTGQGAIIVRDPEETLDIIRLGSIRRHPWFLLQTNYEPWEEPPLYDNRRGPGIDYMMRVGKMNMNLPHMYSVLSKFPVLNDETVYSTVMSPTNLNVYSTMIRYDAPSPSEYIEMYKTLMEDSRPGIPEVKKPPKLQGYIG